MSVFVGSSRLESRRVVGPGPDIYARRTEDRGAGFVAASQPHETHFRRLFESHHAAIQKYCFRRLPASDANDAVAEVFLVAWRRIDDAPIGTGELPWLYGIGRNIVYNARRSARRLGRLRVRLSGVASDAEPGPETQLVQNAEAREALEALAGLRPEDQEIIRLRTWEELPNEQIARILGITVRAVESRLNRARRKLARKLEPPAHRLPEGSPLPIEKGGER